VNGKYLLDTNIIISVFTKDSQIHSRIAKAEEVFVPCISIGELYFGAYKSIKLEENLARIDEFALNNTVLPCDTDTAKKYGDIKSSLKEEGQSIPENNIWIAAIAQQYALTLVTKDPHFKVIENLNIETW
jgi:tRNA(fMet)-specific endonuclease VapC